jgi:hypothetical protein
MNARDLPTHPTKMEKKSSELTGIDRIICLKETGTNFFLFPFLKHSI